MMHEMEQTRMEGMGMSDGGGEESKHGNGEGRGARCAEDMQRNEHGDATADEAGRRAAVVR